jgi:hypothetical protein
MPDKEGPIADFDWRVTSFEGSRREQLRRWAQLPLEDILRALEEMEDLVQQMHAALSCTHRNSVSDEGNVGC